MKLLVQLQFLPTHKSERVFNSHVSDCKLVSKFPSSEEFPTKLPTHLTWCIKFQLQANKSDWFALSGSNRANFGCKEGHGRQGGRGNNAAAYRSVHPLRPSPPSLRATHRLPTSYAVLVLFLSEVLRSQIGASIVTHICGCLCCYEIDIVLSGCCFETSELRFETWVKQRLLWCHTITCTQNLRGPNLKTRSYPFHAMRSINHHNFQVNQTHLSRRVSM